MRHQATAQVKGVLLVHLREFVVETHDLPTWKELEQRLRAIDPEVWTGLMLVSSWYPIGAWNRAFQIVISSGGTDPGSELRRLAHFISERDLNTVFKMLLRLAHPESVLSRASSLWSRYFDVGSLSAKQRGPRSWEVNLEAPVGENAGPGELTCHGVCGWLERAIELTGIKHSHIAHARCRFNGATQCSIDVTW